jgi:hypothetical protein
VTAAAVRACGSRQHVVFSSCAGGTRKAVRGSEGKRRSQRLLSPLAWSGGRTTSYGLWNLACLALLAELAFTVELRRGHSHAHLHGLAERMPHGPGGRSHVETVAARSDMTSSESADLRLRLTDLAFGRRLTTGGRWQALPLRRNGSPQPGVPSGNRRDSWTATEPAGRALIESGLVRTADWTTFVAQEERWAEARRR